MLRKLPIAKHCAVTIKELVWSGVYVTFKHQFMLLAAYLYGIVQKYFPISDPDVRYMCLV